MTEFASLQKKCADKLHDARELHNELCSRVIMDDFKDFEQKMLNRMKKIAYNEWIIDEELRASITKSNDGVMLEIVDERGTAFLWIFTLETPQYYVSDIFLCKGRVCESVKYLKEGDLPNGIEEIKEVIGKLDRTIEMLRKKPELSNVAHSYVSVNPDVECNSLDDVFERVLERDPIIYQ